MALTDLAMDGNWTVTGYHILALLEDGLPAPTAHRVTFDMTLWTPARQVNIARWTNGEVGIRNQRRSAQNIDSDNNSQQKQWQ